MNRSIKILFAFGVIVVLLLVIIFGYLGFKWDRVRKTPMLTYTDKIIVCDGQPEINHSGVDFVNEDSDNCVIQVKWGSYEEDYTFLSLLRVISPSGEVVAFVSGDIVDSELEFPLDELGTYRIESEYFFDGYSFNEEIHRLNPEEELFEIEVVHNSMLPSVCKIEKNGYVKSMSNKRKKGGGLWVPPPYLFKLRCPTRNTVGTSVGLLVLWLDSIISGFACADTHCGFDLVAYDFAISYTARVGGLLNGIDGFLLPFR